MLQDENRDYELDAHDAVHEEARQKPSALIRKAVEGYDKLNGNKFRFTSEFFFHLKKNSNRKSEVCEVCLAGSLASFLLDSKDVLPYYEVNSQIDVFDLHDYISHYYRHNLIDNKLRSLGVTRHLIRDVMVVECVRKGEMAEAAVYYSWFNSVSNDMPFQTLDGEFHVQKEIVNMYHDNPSFAEVRDQSRGNFIHWGSKSEWTEKAQPEFLRRADVLEAAGY